MGSTEYFNVNGSKWVKLPQVKPPKTPEDQFPLIECTVKATFERGGVLGTMTYLRSWGRKNTQTVIRNLTMRSDDWEDLEKVLLSKGAILDGEASGKTEMVSISTVTNEVKSGSVSANKTKT